MTKKSIIVNKKAHSELAKLSEVYNLPYGRLIEAMIYYFKKTGINPKDAVNDNPSIMVKVLDKRIVSFLKVQERDILKPLRADVYNYQQTIVESFDAIIETLKENNRLDSSSDKDLFIRSELKKQQQLLVEIALNLDPKGKTGLQGKIKSIFR